MITYKTPKDKNGNHALLHVYKNGKIICDWQYCARQFFNPKRETESILCKHIKQFKIKEKQGDLSEYEILNN